MFPFLATPHSIEITLPVQLCNENSLPQELSIILRLCCCVLPVCSLPAHDNVQQGPVEGMVCRRGEVQRIMIQRSPLVESFRQGFEYQGPMQHHAWVQLAGMWYMEMVICDSVASIPLGRSCLPDYLERVLRVQKLADVWQIRAHSTSEALAASGSIHQPKPKVHHHVGWAQVYLQW